MTLKKRKALNSLTALAALAIFQSAGLCGADDSFLPTWKLLSAQEKQHFIAGYIQGWNDAAKVTDIAIEYVRENPAKGVEALQKIRGVYSMHALRPDAIAREIDVFYADPDNADAPLTRAVSAAREKAK